MNSKREVWQEAQAAGLADFLQSVSAVFGKDAIDAVAIKTPNGVFTTDDRLLHRPVRVIPGAGLDPEESARIRKEHAGKSNMKYKGGK